MACSGIERVGMYADEEPRSCDPGSWVDGSGDRVCVYLCTAGGTDSMYGICRCAAQTEVDGRDRLIIAENKGRMGMSLAG
jgi:hypothetical protein